MEKLKEILAEEAKASFEGWYRRETDSDKVSREMLGILVARFCEWDIIGVAEVCISALEDANFHDAAAKLADIKEEAEKEFAEAENPF